MNPIWQRIKEYTSVMQNLAEAKQRRTIKDWLIATRPWSFTTSSVPVLVTVAYLFYLWHTEPGCESFDWLNAALCLPLLMIMHAGGNLVSDYFDHVRGIDGEDCVNGVTWIRSGLFAPQEIFAYGLALIAVGACIGMVLLCRSSLAAAWIGVLAVVLPVFYYFFKSHVLGDVDILLCFAILPGVGTCFVSTGNYHAEMLLYCLPFGLHIVAILHANNTRDIDNDRRAGLDTVSGKVGFAASQRIYLAEILLPYVLVAAYCLLCGLSWWLMLTYLSLPVAVKNLRLMMGGDKVGIRTLDQSTAQFQFLFGVLYAFGFVIGGIF